MTTQSMPKGSCTVTQDDGVPVVASSGILTTLRDAAVDTIKLATIRVDAGYVHLTGYVDQVKVCIKTKISALHDASALKALKPYKMKVEAGMAVVYEKAEGLWVKAQGKYAVENLVEAYTRMRKAIAAYVSVVLPKVSQLYHDVYAKFDVSFTSFWEPSVAYAKNGYAYLSAKVGKMMVCVRANGELARQKVLSTYTDTLACGDALVRHALDNIAERYAAIKGNATDLFQPYWIKIEGEFLLMKGKFGNTYVDIKAKCSDVFGEATSSLEPYYVHMRDDCTGLFTKAGERVSPLKTKVCEVYEHLNTVKSTALNLATEKNSQIRTYMDNAAIKATELTAKDGVTSAAVLGTSGGVAGFVAGGAVGAAMGIIPAAFTFGLSIPIGAAIGSGSGLCMGAAAGGATGFFGGKFVGKHKAEIEKHVDAAKHYVQEKLPSSTVKILSSTGSIYSTSTEETVAAAVGGTTK